MVMRVLSMLFLWLVSTALAAAELDVHLSSDRIGFDETVELTVTYSGDSEFDPDLSSLRTDFEILSQSRNHHTQIVNGQISVRQVLKLVLAPERTGEIVIPVLQYEGVRAGPLTLNVIPAEDLKPTARTHFIEAEVSNRSPLVQEQIIYTVRIFQRTPVVDGSLTEPEADGVALERLGTDRSYTVNRDGVDWDVHERRYALFPQRSGQFSLSAVRLRARVAVDGGESGFFFNRQTRQIRLRGPAVELDVRPAPSGDSWWLPATALVATANWLVEGTPRVGDPITLELTVTAHGTQAAQLPTIEPAQTGSARFYLGQSETGSRVLDSGLVSQRRVRHQVVPTRAGELTLDPIDIEWFSTAEQSVKRERVVIDSIDIAAAPLSDLAVTPSLDGREPTTDDSADLARAESVSEQPTVEPTGDDVALSDNDTLIATWRRLVERALPALTVGGVVLLLLAMGVAGVSKLRQRLHRHPNAALRRGARAMRAGDREAVQRQLLEWAAACWDEPPRHLLDISERLRLDPRYGELAERVVRFDASLHGAPDADWQDHDLLTQLRTVRPLQRTFDRPELALPSLGAAWTHLDHIAGKKSE